ncbi:MAG: roadblock/LC7 domain-containing protein [Candidatus Hermodarchaeota archaeon]
MSYSEDELRLKKILNLIINSTPGLKFALITDDTGITILSQAKFKFSDENGISVEKIGAIGGAVFVAGEEQGHILGYGAIDLQITEYLEGMIFSMKVGKGVLCIVADKNAQIGFIRATMKKWAPKIALILNRYLQADQAELGKEVKELFRSDSMGML